MKFSESAIYRHFASKEEIVVAMLGYLAENMDDRLNKQEFFTNTITTEEMMHIIMGSFRLQMFKWRIANFQFDIQRQGVAMLHAISTLIKN